MKTFLAVVIAVLVLFTAVGSAQAADITLIWGTSQGATGYKIYYGSASNNYSNSNDVGNVLTYTRRNIPDGKYYYAATAYDASNLESIYSRELCFVVAGQQITSCTLTPPPDFRLSVAVSVTVNP